MLAQHVAACSSPLSRDKLARGFGSFVERWISDGIRGVPTTAMVRPPTSMCCHSARPIDSAARSPHDDDSALDHVADEDRGLDAVPSEARR